MKILSLFDGMSCGRIALERAGIKVDAYYASEIDKYAIQVSQKNYPDIVHLGDVKNIFYDRYMGNIHLRKYGTVSLLPDGIDMIIGGSPCQDLSIAKNGGKGLLGEKSSLFFEYVRLLKEVKPKYFLLENVASMKKEDKEEMTRVLSEIYPDVQCYNINSALVSAQQRKRLYWTNIQGVEQPQDKGILLKDILEIDVDEKYQVKDIDFIDGGEKKNTYLKFIGGIRNKDWAKDGKNLSRNFSQGDRVYSPEGKSVSLSANGGGRGAKTGLYAIEPIIRKLTPIECERLQTVPDNYTEGVSNSQRYKMLGNGWTVDVIAHIFSFLR